MTLVVTDRRLLVLQGKKVVKRNALSDWTVRVDLVSGAQVTLEANRVMKPARLVEAIKELATS